MSKTPEQLALDIVNEINDDIARALEKEQLVQTDNSPREEDPDYGPCNDPGDEAT